MRDITEAIHDYCAAHSDAEDTLLKELERETNLKTLQPRMLSGHLQGAFLSMLSSLVKPTAILEIGTFTGYSALCLAKGLRAGGRIITIDNNRETAHMAKDFFKRSAYAEKIEFIEGDAIVEIEKLNLVFDLVFIDADKKNYGFYYDRIIDKVRPGGLILADNVLWSYKVLEPGIHTDKATQIIQAFNEKIKADARVEKVMLPLRDGITLIRKTGS